MPDAQMKRPPKNSLDHNKLRLTSLETDALFYSIGEGAVVIDKKARISQINKMALEMLGFEEAEVMGKWYPKTVVAEDESGKVIPNLKRPITQVFISGKPVFSKIYYRKKDGSKLPVALTVSPVMVNDKPVGAIEVFRDITEEIELEKAKDDFISIASHQLRTPATVVKQYIGMMIEGYSGKLTAEQQRMLNIAYEYNEHQLDTINDLLKVAQADTKKIRMYRKKIDLNKLLKETVESLKLEYQKKQLGITLKQLSKPLVAKVDPLHIRMVVENLLDNASKYSPPGGTVTVSLSTTATQIKISVADQGIGIDSRDMPKLFKKFSRINDSLTFADGTGLGLYWAKNLITMHKGTITVNSTPNKGTVFTITLPKGKLK